jgi:hypothetical protein
VAQEDSCSSIAAAQLLVASQRSKLAVLAAAGK